MVSKILLLLQEIDNTTYLIERDLYKSTRGSIRYRLYSNRSDTISGRVRSSVAERSAYIRLVAGSIPAGPTIYFTNKY